MSCLACGDVVKEQLPPDSAAFELLQKIITALGRGTGVAVLEQDKELTPNQAAELVGVSRPHLLTFMDAGALAFTRVGTHRRIKVSDLLEFNERRQGAYKAVAEARANAAAAAARHVEQAAPLSAEALDQLDQL